jgi:hypothetical protein
MSKYVGSTMRSLFDELGETDNLDLLTRKKVVADELRAEWRRRARVAEAGDGGLVRCETCSAPESQPFLASSRRTAATTKALSSTPSPAQ